MAITNKEKEKINLMCPAAKIVNLGNVVQETHTELNVIDQKIPMAKHEHFFNPKAAGDVDIKTGEVAPYDGAPTVQPNLPCTIQVDISGGSGSEDITVTITGIDSTYVAREEELVNLGAGTHQGNRAWASISNVKIEGTFDGATVVIQNGDGIGFVRRPTAVYKEAFDGGPEAVGTLNTGADWFHYIPSGTLDGLKPLEVWYAWV